LNCYSCPGSLGSCPLGALQGSISNPNQQISFYVLGFLTLVGGLLGRAVCGWACPFGLVQDWLHKIPTPKWKPEHKVLLHKLLLQLKYLLLLLFVVLLPFLPTVTGHYGDVYFCAYICPSGTLFAGIPLLSVNDQLRPLAGWLFGWKGLLLFIFLSLSVQISRPSAATSARSVRSMAFSTASASIASTSTLTPAPAVATAPVSARWP